MCKQTPLPFLQQLPAAVTEALHNAAAEQPLSSSPCYILDWGCKGLMSRDMLKARHKPITSSFPTAFSLKTECGRRNVKRNRNPSRAAVGEAALQQERTPKVKKDAKQGSRSQWCTWTFDGNNHNFEFKRWGEKSMPGATQSAEKVWEDRWPLPPTQAF